MSAGEWKELYRIYLINTENPCVGGSIPSLPTQREDDFGHPFLFNLNMR